MFEKIKNIFSKNNKPICNHDILSSNTTIEIHNRLRMVTPGKVPARCRVCNDILYFSPLQIAAKCKLDESKFKGGK